MSPNPALLTWPRPVAAGGSGTTGFVTSAGTSATTGTTTRTYSDIAIGDAASDRNVIIVCHARSVNILSATIGGVSATLHASFTDGVLRTAIFSAVVTSGTTADIVVTHSSNPGGVVLGVYAAYGTLTYDSHDTEGDGRIVGLTAPSDALIVVGLSSTFYGPGDFSLGDLQTYEVTQAGSVSGWGGMDQPAAGAWSLELTTAITNYSNHAYLAVAFTLT